MRRLGLRLLVIAATCAGALFAPAQAGPALGRDAPSLVVATLDGGSFDLRAERGHVVLVNFWATWCPPCRQEMPVLEAFSTRHQADGVVVIGISVDRRRDRREVQDVMHSFSYRAGLMDGAKVNGFGPPQALPMTYLIDRAGVVRAILAPGRGELTDEMLEDALRPLLDAPNPME